MSLFAAAPLLASFGASAIATAAVGVLAVLAAITVVLILWPEERAVQDVVSVGTVAVIAALSVWTAAMRERRARAIAAAGEASARLEVAFDRAPVGLAFFDHRGRYVRVNDRLAEINGVPAEAHLGRTPAEVVPAMASSIPVDLRRVLETGEPVVDVEVAGETPARPGETREFVVSYWPVRSGGRIMELGAVVYDVTARRAAERALRRETERYETLLRALGEAGEGMLVVEGERVVFANAAFSAMTGYAADELTAGDPFALLEPARRDAALRALERGEIHEEVEVLHRSGHLVHLEIAGVPLQLDGHRQVVLVARDVTARRRAEAEREALLAAEQAARAEAEAAERRSEFTALMSTALEEGLSVRRTAERIAQTAVRDFATTCVVWLREGRELRRAATAASTPARERIIGQLEAEYPLVRQRAIEVLGPDAPTIVRGIDYDAIATDARHAELLGALGTPDLLVLPLRARGRDLGRLVVGFVELREAQDSWMPALFVEIARRAALGLDNARLYEERSAVARTLQRSLLPPELPEIPGAELAARYVAAGEGNEVGGDFYDAFSLGGEDWAIAIGDVCGKGAEAAAITALARYTMRAAVLHSSHPRDVLAELNEVLLRHGLEYRFASVLFATLRMHAGGGTVLVASGGHPLPLVLRADGRVEKAGRPGTLLGIVRTPRLDAAEVELGPGDALVIYTDGVIEASPSDDAFGPERFALFLAELAGEDAEGIADRIERAVLGIQNGRPRDDVAVVALRLTPQGRG